MEYINKINPSDGLVSLWGIVPNFIMINGMLISNYNYYFHESEAIDPNSSFETYYIVFNCKIEGYLLTEHEKYDAIKSILLKIFRKGDVHDAKKWLFF